MRILPGLLFFLITLPALAQDTLLKVTGEELLVKVISLDEEEVHYKRFDNVEGPTYVLPLEEVFILKIEGGEKYVFSAHLQKTSAATELSKQELYRKGQLDAEEYYQGTKDIAIAALVTCVTPILGIPALAIVAITDPSFQPAVVTEPELLNSQHYREGYVKRTKQLRNQSYLKGAGFVVGVYLLIVGIVVTANQ